MELFLRKVESRSYFPFSFLKSLRVFLTCWSLLSTQVWATHEFFRGLDGLLIIDNEAPLPTGREFRNTKQRAFQFAREMANNRGIDSHTRRIASRLQRVAAQLTSPENNQERSNQQFIEMRNLVRELQEAAPEVIRRVLLENETLNNLTTLPEQREHHNSILTAQNRPPYCERYPLIEREAIDAFYGNPEQGDDLECYNTGSNNVGLDLRIIADTMLSIEGDAYEVQSRELKNKLILKTVEGILEEGQAYSGLFDGTDDDHRELLQCAQSRGRRNMGNSDLIDKVQEIHRGRPQTVESLNEEFGGAENRLNAFIANQVRQALIIGNLYNITSRANSVNGRQLATIGGEASDNFSVEVRESCLTRMEEQFGFAYPDRHNNAALSRLHQRCQRLVEEEQYSNRSDCLAAYRDMVTENSLLERAQTQCYYELSNRQGEAPRDFLADHLLPLMSSSVNSNPLLFNREDSRSLIPFVSSNSNYVPSDLANTIQALPGAGEISVAVENLLATNPTNPKEAIDNLLNSSPVRERLEGIIQLAGQNQVLKNKFKSEVKDYQEELAESAYDVCHDDGQYLHHFPSLVEEVIDDELSMTTDSAQRQRILATYQASQCWMLNEEPPEETGGLPVGFVVMGVGAIALGLIPGIGWAAAGALMAAGTAVGATDAALRLSEAQNRFEATSATFNGGWADTQSLLLSASARTDAQTAAWVEGLSIGVLDGAGLLFRGSRLVAAADEVTPSRLSAVSTTSPTSNSYAQRTVLTNAALNQTDRISMIRELYPDLNQLQIDAILRAHNEISCPVFNCSPAQLRAKLTFLREAEVPLNTRKDILRRGIAGAINEDQQLESVINLGLDISRYSRNQITDPFEIVEALSAQSVRDIFSLDRSTLINRAMPNSADLEARSIRIQGSQNLESGNLSLETVRESPDDYLVLYHGTSNSSASEILEEGVDLTKGDGEFGRGMYFTTSRQQASNWANRANTGDGQVLQLIIPRSRLEEIYETGHNIGFPRETARSNVDEESNILFSNFINANRILRDTTQENIEAARIAGREIEETPDPLSHIDFIAGPTVSHRSIVFDQIKFGNTETMRSLFTGEESQFLMRAVE